MEIKGYKNVDYNSFQDNLDTKLKESKKEDVALTFEIGVKSVATVKNAFNRQIQVTSDEVLTKVMDAIGLDGFVLWEKGKRKYYVSTK